MYFNSALICESGWNRVDSTWSVKGRLFSHAAGRGTLVSAGQRKAVGTWAAPIENKTLNPIRSLVCLLRAASPVHRPVAPTAYSFTPSPNAAVA